MKENVEELVKEKLGQGQYFRQERKIQPSPSILKAKAT